MNSLRTERIEILQGMQGTKAKSNNHVMIYINLSFMELMQYYCPVNVVDWQFTVWIILKYIWT